MSGRGHSSWRDWWHTDPTLYESWHSWHRWFVTSRAYDGPREALARTMQPVSTSPCATHLVTHTGAPIWEGRHDLVRHLKYELARAAELGAQ